MAPQLPELPRLNRGPRARGRAARALAATLALLAALGGTPPGARAADAGIALAGRMGDKALLVIEGRTQVLDVGQSAAGVRLLRWQGDAALLEVQGATLTLRAGAAAVAAGRAGTGAPPGGREVVIPAASGGQFLTDGAINGRAVRFLVDTGATLVALPRSEAERLGVDMRGARQAVSRTAGGEVPVQLVTLARVRIGEVELANVAAVVIPAALPFVLLGHSALERFQMKRENDVMRLELR